MVYRIGLGYDPDETKKGNKMNFIKALISPLKKLSERGLKGEPGNIWELIIIYLMACGIGANIVFAFVVTISLF